MARSVNVNFRMDSDLKKNMEKVCMDMGLSMTAAGSVSNFVSALNSYLWNPGSCQAL